MSNAIESQGLTLEIGDVGDSPAVLTEISEIVDVNLFDGQANEIDTTNLQSTAKTRIMGLQDFGSATFEINFLSADAGQVEARAAKASRTKKTFLVTFSNGYTAAFDGYVTQAPISAGVDSKVSGSLTILVDGDVTFA
jgi:hypothetical protein